jgi:tetratricopeptide (TPR) repeat protein
MKRFTMGVVMTSLVLVCLVSGCTGQTQDAEEVTTSSSEALGYYTEARQLHLNDKYAESITLYEKALELDPEFAMAYRGLAVAYNNEGNWKKYEENIHRAFEHVDKISDRERYAIEGEYYRLQEATFGEAIQAYEKLLENEPENDLAHYYLGNMSRMLERYDETVKHFEVLRGMDYPMAGTYNVLAGGYYCLGKIDEGLAVLREFVERNPESVEGQLNLASYLIHCGELDEAATTLEKAKSLEPDNPWNAFQQWNVAVLREEWDEADARTGRMTASKNPLAQMWGTLALANARLYQGQTSAAFDLIEERLEDETVPQSRARLRNQAARILLAQGDAEKALEWSRAARRENERFFTEWEAMALGTAALAELGRAEDAKALAEELKQATKDLLTEKEERRFYHATGIVASMEGETVQALEDLTRAESLLPARGYNFARLPQHVPVWFSLGEAYVKAGEEAKAAEWFRRIADNDSERIWWPVPYVRSFYHLGKIHENLGEMGTARTYYQRFTDYWKDGDLDRDRVKEARSKLPVT